MFIWMAEDQITGLLTREKALEIIRATSLEKVELGSFRSGETLYFTLGLKYMWAWDSNMIDRELKKFDIPTIRDELEFYGSTVDSFPLFVLKKGWDKAVCVSPTEFEEVDVELEFVRV